MKKEYKNPFIVLTTIETAGMIAASVDGFTNTLDSTEIDDANNLLGRENNLWGSNDDTTDDGGMPSFNLWED